MLFVKRNFFSTFFLDRNLKMKNLNWSLSWTIERLFSCCEKWNKLRQWWLGRNHKKQFALFSCCWPISSLYFPQVLFWICISLFQWKIFSTVERKQEQGILTKLEAKGKLLMIRSHCRPWLAVIVITCKHWVFFIYIYIYTYTCI